MAKINTLHTDDELLNMITNFFEMQRYDKAQPLLEIYLKKHPDNVECLACYGYCLSHFKKNEQARDVLERAVRLDPRNYAARLYLSRERVHFKRLEDAKELIDGLLRENPRDPMLLAERAQLECEPNLLMGNRETARNLLRQALKISPGDIPSLNLLIQIELFEGSVEKSKSLLEILIHCAAQSEAAAERTAQYVKDVTPESWRDIRPFIAQFPNNYEIRKAIIYSAASDHFLLRRFFSLNNLWNVFVVRGMTKLNGYSKKVFTTGSLLQKFVFLFCLLIIQPILLGVVLAIAITADLVTLFWILFGMGITIYIAAILFRFYRIMKFARQGLPD